jgi:hypothetical protein
MKVYLFLDLFEIKHARFQYSNAKEMKKKCE